LQEKGLGLFGFGRTKATGIHISGQTVRVAALDTGKTGVRPLVLAADELERPFDPLALSDGQQRQELAAKLVAIAAAYDFDYSNACFSLDRRLGLIQRRPLIAGTMRENREQLLWESEQILAGDAKAFSCDFALTSQWGFVVAARHRALDCYRALGKETAVGRLDVDLVPFALYNASECANLLAKDKFSLLLYADVDEAWLLLIEEGELSALTSCVWEEEDDAAEALAGAARKLLSEGSSGLQRLWGAGFVYWSEGLAEHLGVPHSILDPLATVNPKLLGSATPVQRSAYAIAVGLAQRGLAR
jgi:hypothetical protein